MIQDIILPSKPKVIREDKTSGTYEIDGLYPGYGHEYRTHRKGGSL